MNYENIVEDKKTEIKVLKEKEIFLKKYGTGELEIIFDKYQS